MDYKKTKQNKDKKKIEKLGNNSGYIVLFIILSLIFGSFINQNMRGSQYKNLTKENETVKLVYSDEIVINTPKVEELDGPMFNDQSEILAEAIVNEKNKKVKVETLSKKPFKEWESFLKHVEKNPFSGKVFAEGNHLEIATKHINRYKGFDGCHHYILVSLHYSETGLQMNNGWNGQGVFQHYTSSTRYKPNSTPTPAELKQQTKKTCEFIKSKIGADLSSLENVNLIGKALALYNGCYSPEIGAYATNDFGKWNGWDKCPYVANKLQSNKSKLQCAVDGCRQWNYRQTYGTLTFIAYLINNNV